MTLLAIDTDINQGLLEDLLALYNEAEHIMAGKVAKRVAKGITETGWNEDTYTSVTSLREEIEKTLNDVTKKAQSKVSVGILKAYKEGVNGAEVDTGVKQTMMRDLFISAPLQNLLLSTNKLVGDVNVQVLRNVDDKYRKIQAEATSMLLTGVETRIQASQRMLNKMADAGITNFIDKSGRSWNLASYSEMAVRTVSSHAALQGYMDKLQDLDQDLVKVSSIGATCPLCAKWQGVALSISGKTPGYLTVETARSQGLFHPNCKHTLIMYDEELDGPVQKEPKSEAQTQNITNRYDLVQQQRSNERHIRYWKRREDLAVTPQEKIKAKEETRHWQQTNLLFCEKNNLHRRYEREGVRTGKVGQTKDLFVGGHLKEYEKLFEDVLGDNPKKAFMKMNLQYFADDKGVTYEKWLKAEIHDLSQWEVDKVYIKDPAKKEYTPTTMYKKYIGDNPASDYAAISIHDKGTKEFKLEYGKWLKQQVDGIGVDYKVKPTTKEIVLSIDEADKGLTASKLFKKYYGENPTSSFKAEKGYMDKGEYSKWLTGKVKALKAGEVTKVVPFDNVVLSNQRKTVAKLKGTISSAESKLIEKEIANYKKLTDMTIETPKEATNAMKIMSSKVNEATGFDKKVLEAKYEYLKQKDLELLEKDIKQAPESTADYEMNWLKTNILDKSSVDGTVKEHVQKKYDMWSQKKAELNKEYLAKEIAAKKALEAEKKAMEAAKKKAIAKRQVVIDKLKIDMSTLSDSEKAKRLSKIDDTFVLNEVKKVDKATANLVDKRLEELKPRLTPEMIDNLLEQARVTPSIKAHTSEDSDMWISGLSSSERTAINKYTSHWYSDINDVYRKGNKEDSSLIKWGDDITKALGKASTTEDMVLRRAINPSDLSHMLGGKGKVNWVDENLSLVNSGSYSAIDDGFLSCTPYKDKGFHKNVDLRFFVPKGSKVGYVEKISAHSSEKESIVQRGAKFRVLKVEKDSHDKYVAYLELKGTK